jgi:hypothetical protein
VPRKFAWLTGSCHIANGSTENWGLIVPSAVIDINTRQIQLHGFSPAEILIGSNPVSTHIESPTPFSGVQASTKELAKHILFMIPPNPDPSLTSLPTFGPGIAFRPMKRPLVEFA